MMIINQSSGEKHEQKRQSPTSIKNLSQHLSRREMNQILSPKVDGRFKSQSLNGTQCFGKNSSSRNQSAKRVVPLSTDKTMISVLNCGQTKQNNNVRSASTKLRHGEHIKSEIVFGQQKYKIYDPSTVASQVNNTHYLITKKQPSEVYFNSNQQKYSQKGQRVMQKITTFANIKKINQQKPIYKNQADFCPKFSAGRVESPNAKEPVSGIHENIQFLQDNLKQLEHKYNNLASFYQNKERPTPLSGQKSNTFDSQTTPKRDAHTLSELATCTKQLFSSDNLTDLQQSSIKNPDVAHLMKIYQAKLTLDSSQQHIFSQLTDELIQYLRDDKNSLPDFERFASTFELSLVENKEAFFQIRHISDQINLDLKKVLGTISLFFPTQVKEQRYLSDMTETLTSSREKIARQQQYFDLVEQLQQDTDQKLDHMRRNHEQNLTSGQVERELTTANHNLKKELQQALDGLESLKDCHIMQLSKMQKSIDDLNMQNDGLRMKVEFFSKQQIILSQREAQTNNLLESLKQKQAQTTRGEDRKESLSERKALEAVVNLTNSFFGAMRNLQKAVHKKESVQTEKLQFESCKKELEQQINTIKTNILQIRDQPLSLSDNSSEIPHRLVKFTKPETNFPTQKQKDLLNSQTLANQKQDEEVVQLKRDLELIKKKFVSTDTERSRVVHRLQSQTVRILNIKDLLKNVDDRQTESVTNIKLQVESLTKRLNNLLQSHIELKNLIDYLKSQNSVSLQNYKTKERELQVAKSEFASTKADYKDQIKRNKENYMHQIEQLKMETVKNSEVTNLNQRLQQLQAENSQLKVQVEAALNQNELDLQQEKKEHARRLAVLQQSNSEQTQKVLEEQSNDYMLRLQTLQSKSAFKQDQNKSKLDKIFVENQTLREQAEVLNCSVQSLEASLLEHQLNQNSLEKTIEKCLSEIKSYKDIEMSLNEKNLTLVQELTLQKEILQKSENEIQNLQQVNLLAISSRTTEIQALQQQLEQNKTIEVAGYESKIASLNEAFQVFREESVKTCDIQKKQLNECTEKLKVSEKALKQEEYNYQSQIANYNGLKEQVVKYQSQIEELDRIIKQVTLQRDEYQEKINNNVIEFQQINGNAQQITKQKDQLQIEVEELQNQLGQAQKDRQFMNEENMKLKQQNEYLELKHQTKNADFEQVQKEQAFLITTHQNELQNLNSKITFLQNQLEESLKSQELKVEQVIQLQQILKNEQERTKMLEFQKNETSQQHCREIEELTATIEEFKLHNLELVKKMASLQDDEVIREIEIENDNLHNTKAELIAQVEETQQLNRVQNQKLEESYQTVAVLQQRVENYKNAASEQASLILTLKNELQACEQANREADLKTQSIIKENIANLQLLKEINLKVVEQQQNIEKYQHASDLNEQLVQNLKNELQIQQQINRDADLQKQQVIKENTANLNQLNDSNAKVTALQNRIEKYQQTLEEQNSSVQNLRNELSLLQQANQEADLKTQSIIQENIANIQRLQENRRQLEITQSQSQAQQLRINELQAKQADNFSVIDENQKQINKFRQIFQKNIEEKKQIKDQIQELTTQRDDFQNQINTLCAFVLEANQDYAQLEGEYAGLYKWAQRIIFSNNQRQLRLMQFLKEYQQLKTQQKTLRLEFENMQSFLSQQVKIIQIVFTERISQFQKKYQDDLQTANSIINEKQNQLDLFQSQQSSSVDQVQLHIAKLTKEIQLQSKNHLQVEQSLKEQLNKSTVSCQEFNSKWQETQDQNDQLKSSLKSGEQRTNELVEQVKRQKQQLAELREQVNALRKENESVTAELQTMQCEQRQMMLEQADKLAQQEANYKKEQSEASAGLETTTKELKNAQRALIALKEQLSATESQIETQTNEKAKKQSSEQIQLEQLQNQNSQLLDQIKQLESQLEQNSSLAQFEVKLNELRNQLKNCVQEVSAKILTKMEFELKQIKQAYAESNIYSYNLNDPSLVLDSFNDQVESIAIVNINNQPHYILQVKQNNSIIVLNQAQISSDTQQYVNGYVDGIGALVHIHESAEMKELKLRTESISKSVTEMRREIFNKKNSETSIDLHDELEYIQARNNMLELMYQELHLQNLILKQQQALLNRKSIGKPVTKKDEEIEDLNIQAAKNSSYSDEEIEQVKEQNLFSDNEEFKSVVQSIDQSKELEQQVQDLKFQLQVLQNSQRVSLVSGGSDGAEDEFTTIAHIKGTLIQFLKLTPFTDKQNEELLKIIFSMMMFTPAETQDLYNSRMVLKSGKTLMQQIQNSRSPINTSGNSTEGEKKIKSSFMGLFNRSKAQQDKSKELPQAPQPQPKSSNMR